MRVGLVCPYSFDVLGGVQVHVRDLAEHLIGAGHTVSVLAPADDDTPVPDYVESAGRAVPVKVVRPLAVTAAVTAATPSTRRIETRMPIPPERCSRAAPEAATAHRWTVGRT
mgnify:CR=1 FL=1